MAQSQIAILVRDPDPDTLYLGSLRLVQECVNRVIVITVTVKTGLEGKVDKGIGKRTLLNANPIDPLIVSR